MTEQEKQEIVAGVLQALKTNSLTLDQLSETAECSDSDFVELSKGRKISAENLSKHFVDKEFSNISERALSNKVLTGHINKMTTEYNVSVFHPGEGIDGTDKYTLETAIAKIPEHKMFVSGRRREAADVGVHWRRMGCRKLFAGGECSHRIAEG